MTFVARQRLGISKQTRVINHARSSQSPRFTSSSSFFPSCDPTLYFNRFQEVIARHRGRWGPFVDPLRLRIIAFRSITRSLSRFLVDSKQTDGRTVASPRGFAPIPRNQHKLGPRYETLRRPTRACGSPRYPRYASTPARSWRESHIVRRGVVVAQGSDPSYKRRSAATAVRLRPL